MASDQNSRNERLNAIAFLLIIVSIAFVVWWLRPQEPKFSSDAGYQEQDPAYYPGGRRCQPLIINRLPWRERLERAEACRESAEMHRLQVNDLIQQRRAAYAAEASAVYANNQTWIALIGFAVGFLTLCAAIVAAYFAKKAAHAAENAVRANISFVSAHMEIEKDPHHTAIIWIEFKNTGNSQAENFDFSVSFEFSGNQIPARIVQAEHHPTMAHLLDIPPQTTEKKKAFTSKGGLNDAEYAEMENGGLTITTSVCYSYETLGSKEPTRKVILKDLAPAHGGGFPLRRVSNVLSETG